MTKIIFFDTDCLSSFLWIHKEHLLVQAYPGCLQIPRSVYEELSKVTHLKAQVDVLVGATSIEIIDITTETDEFKTYYDLYTGKVKGRTRIGRGEAAAISLAKHQQGVLASNNLRDIAYYIKEYSLSYLTTGEILVEMLSKSIITENEAELMWTGMLGKRRSLPTNSFKEYQAKRSELNPK